MVLFQPALISKSLTPCLNPGVRTLFPVKGQIGNGLGFVAHTVSSPVVNPTLVAQKQP